MLSPSASATGVVADELAADDERLREPFGPRLHGVVDAASPSWLPSPSSRRKPSLILRRRDDQDVADARQHQRRQRVVDHRLVVDRQQLLGDDERQRMEAGAGPAGEEYPFHLA